MRTKLLQEIEQIGNYSECCSLLSTGCKGIPNLRKRCLTVIVLSQGYANILHMSRATYDTNFIEVNAKT